MAYIGRDISWGVFEKQVLTPDSSTTTFTLSYAAGSANSLLVVYSGVIQEPQVAYSLSGGGSSITTRARRPAPRLRKEPRRPLPFWPTSPRRATTSWSSPTASSTAWSASRSAVTVGTAVVSGVVLAVIFYLAAGAVINAVTGGGQQP